MMDINTSDVRVGSSTDLTAPKSNFRFTPESGLKSDIARGPKACTQPDIVRDGYSESAVAIRQRGQAMTGLFSPGP